MFDKVIDDKNEVLTPNPLTSKEEADNYIENGAVPIIGLSAGPGGSVIKGENVQKAVKSQYESVGANASKKLSKKAKMSGYKEQSYSSDIDYVNTRSEVNDLQLDVKNVAQVKTLELNEPKQEEFDFSVSLDKYDELVKKVNMMQSKIDSLELTLHTFKLKFKQFLDNTAFGEEY